MGGGGGGPFTFMIASAFEKPVAVARMNVVPPLTPIDTVTSALDAPSAIVTVAGTLAISGLRLESLITCPPEAAGVEIETVSVPGPVLTSRFSGFGVRVIPWVETLTVDGSLSKDPLLTINWIT